MIFSRAIARAPIAVALSVPAWADTTGLFVSVHDGDTLTVLVGKQQVKVRLAEIDAPELRQPFSNRSKQSLANLCFQQSASEQPRMCLSQLPLEQFPAWVFWQRIDKDNGFGGFE